ncbi:MAG: hypothetical protein OEY29_15400 [Gammaproteobacteria bacterium]|nr:hypothetical protein [Gammaproteobacteria bacterium]
MKGKILPIFGCSFSVVIISVLAVIPVSGIYYLGKSIWYVSYYENSTGKVVSCSENNIKMRGVLYAMVIESDSGLHITANHHVNKEMCFDAQGETVNILINPNNKKEGVINTFRERWKIPFIFLGLPVIILIIYFKKRFWAAKNA